jgi:predicted ATPase/DNA-binding winged helix-turn-helix (wHTH) protein
LGENTPAAPRASDLRGWPAIPALPPRTHPTPDAGRCFGRFHLLPAQRLLLEDDIQVHVGGRALDILIALTEHAGTVVSKEALLARVWPDTFVDAGSLRVHVAALRKALRDQDSQLIRTVPGHGYQFAGRVAGAAAATPPPPPVQLTAPAPRGLPTVWTRIIGRSDFIDSVVAQMPHRRLITIVGPGGIGKTTVAVACAEALAGFYRHGVGFIDLALVTEPESVAAALANALGVAITANDPQHDLIPFLRQQEMLLVIDNCEHVVDAAAELVEAIAAAAPAVHILATSREALRFAGETVRSLPPLPSPPADGDLTAAAALAYPAVQLFVERAAAVQEGFQLSDADAPLAGEICRRLDGVALAIELAAARVDMFGLAWLAAHLDERLRILNRGRRTAAARHQSLTAMLDWSYDLLSDQERATLQRVAVFAGDFTLAAAITAATEDGIGPVQVADAVGGLVSKSLATSDISGPVTRYRLMETTRAYACAKWRSNIELPGFAGGRAADEIVLPHAVAKPRLHAA